MKLPRKGSKREYLMVNGGPWGGLPVLLPETTMVFTVGKWRGQYIRGVWHNVR